MKCETCFDLMTAPASSPDQRREVRRHLSDCASCRRLADALSPALHLFTSSGDPCAEPEELDEYLYSTWTELPADEPSFESSFETSFDRSLQAESSSDPSSTGPSSSSHRPLSSDVSSADRDAELSRWDLQRLTWWVAPLGFAAALMMGVVLGAASRRSDRDDRPVGPPLASAQHDSNLLSMSQSCMLTPESRRPVSVRPNEAQPHVMGLQCCTYCHTAGSPLSTSSGVPVTLERLRSSCLMCHVALQ